MRVLVVDDDIQLAALIAFALRREGFEALKAHDGQAALAMWEAEQPDLVILDVNLPGLDGYGVLGEIRAVSATPVIMLTVRGDEDDMVRGLAAGADDYIAKPFSPRNLLARVHAVLRRSGGAGAVVVAAGDLSLDVERMTLRRGDGEPIRLTPLEFRLLHYLFAHRGHVLTTEDIIRQVWGYDAEGDRTALKQLVRRLRVKIEDDPAQPRIIETVVGVGYSLVAPTAGYTPSKA